MQTAIIPLLVRKNSPEVSGSSRCFYRYRPVVTGFCQVINDFKALSPSSSTANSAHFWRSNRSLQWKECKNHHFRKNKSSVAWSEDDGRSKEMRKCPHFAEDACQIWYFLKNYTFRKAFKIPKNPNSVINSKLHELGICFVCLENRPP